LSSLDTRFSINTLYQEHHSWLVRLLVNKLNCPFDAADIAHDAFIRLLNNPRKFDNLTGARHYLSRMANGMSIDLWRKQQLEQAYFSSLMTHSAESIITLEQQHIILETLIQVDKQLRDLPNKVAVVFIAVNIEGLTYQQAAIKQKISVSSVKNYLAIAMVKLVRFKLSNNN
jgi:RNA polymerase sigma-70 factor (ECF subfamily)